MFKQPYIPAIPSVKEKLIAKDQEFTPKILPKFMPPTSRS